MDGRTILILGGADDSHAAYMLEHLATRGYDVEFLDSRQFPLAMRIEFDPARGCGAIRLAEGRTIHWSQIFSVYWRCYYGVSTPDLADDDQAYIAQNDARSLFESLLIQLPARWVNGWEAFQSHQTKPAQLARVAALGVPVPPTVLTNDGTAVQKFAKRHPASIFKPVQGGDQTRRLSTAHLTDQNLAKLCFAPVTVQAEVQGTNIRIFVAGDHVMACEVRTQAMDFREDPEPQILVHSLDDEIQTRCRRIARELKLIWTGMDFRLTPEGQYIFLEANPSPMFLEFERQTGLPLTCSLADLLIPSSTQ